MSLPKASADANGGTCRPVCTFCRPYPARLTDEQVQLDDNDRQNRLMGQIADSISEQPCVTVSYFKSDGHKQGGSYETITGSLKRIDDYERQLVMVDGKTIPFGYIIDLSVDGDTEQ